MGMGLFRNCSTNYNPGVTPQPSAPDPKRWTLLQRAEFSCGYVLRVHYPNCTNFEGEKVMVYRGVYTRRTHLDPHFYDSDDAPFARFRPDDEGWHAACDLAASFRAEEGGDR